MRTKIDSGIYWVTHSKIKRIETALKIKPKGFKENTAKRATTTMHHKFKKNVDWMEIFYIDTGLRHHHIITDRRQMLDTVFLLGLRHSTALVCVQLLV
uniref:Uncharacterized protein n=1 Tax=Pararge aegeria TaxID=116150 RepID=S4P1U4_9NEOP